MKSVEKRGDFGCFLPVTWDKIKPPKRNPLILRISCAQIEAVKFVVVDRIPIPPLSLMGLSRFAEFERSEYGGITYLNTYFLKSAEADDESLHFHVVHVVQWHILGAERFLALYANGFEAAGYRNSPLEKMAYDAQELFDHSAAIFDAERLVAEKFRALIKPTTVADDGF